MIWAAMACTIAGCVAMTRRYAHPYDSVPYSAWSMVMSTLFGVGCVFTVFGLLSP